MKTVRIQGKEWRIVMKTYWMVLLGILAAAFQVAADPVDPDPDGIGIYFDEGAVADIWCVTAEPGTQVTAYLCLTRGVDTSGFDAWEGRIESSVAEALAGFNIRGGGVNASVAPEFVVSFGTPLPWQLSTVLLDITVDVVWEWSIGLRVWPVVNPSGDDLLPAYAAAGNPGVYRTLGYSLGWDPQTKVPNWCAAVNDDNCLNGPSIETGDSTWGEIKVLYR